MAVGGPLGTLVGQKFGWRMAFIILAMVVVVLAGALFQQAKSIAAMEIRTVKKEISAFKRKEVWAAYGVTFSTTLIYMSVYSFLAAAISATGNSAFLSPFALVLFGIGAFIGLMIGGKYTDDHPLAIKLISTVICASIVLIMSRYTHDALSMSLMAFLLGIAGFSLNPGVVSRVFDVARDAPTLANAVNISSLQSAITIVPVFANAIFSRGGQYSDQFIMGVPWAIVAVILILFFERKRKTV